MHQLAVVALASLALAGPAAAQHTHMTALGSVTAYGSDLAGYPEFARGQPMRLDAVLADNPVDSVADPTRGQYFDSILSASMTIGGYTATGLGGYIVVDNDFMGGGDHYSFVIASNAAAPPSQGQVSGPYVGSRFPYLIAMTLFDATATAFDSDAFPKSLDLASFADRRAELGFALSVIPGVAFGATSAVTSVDSLVMTTVPEPATWALFAAGGLLLGRRRRKQPR